MKNLQNSYNLIKEGKGNKEIFIKQARREFPQFITNVENFEQIVSKLKQKSIIVETREITNSVETNWFNIFNKNIQEAKAEEKKTSTEVKDVQASGYDYSDEKNIENVFGEEFLKGYYAEMKDPKNEAKTEEQIKAIVAKNLTKDSLYYVKDGQFGVKGLGYTEAPTTEAKGKYKSSGYGDITEGTIKEERESDKFGAEVVVRNTAGLPDYVIDMIETPMIHLGEWEQDGSIFADLENKDKESVVVFYDRLELYKGEDEESLEEEDSGLKRLQKLIDEILNTKK
tara:strand:- start:12 stop:863 length:852 start_codon:yes stop_codon:yes gene_type:complete